MEIEFLKNYKEGTKTWQKGKRVHVTRQRAAELEKSGAVVIVGSESNRWTQERTAAVNAMAKGEAPTDEPKNKTKEE